MKHKNFGFTIVELLIVIVVIGILAAISIVAYNSVQEKARLTTIKSDLSNINKAIQSFYALKGNYPSSGGSWSSQTDATKDSFIPGLSPEVMPSIPRAKSVPSNTATYYYSSNGAEYKLLYFHYATVPASTLSDSFLNDAGVQSMKDPVRPTRGFGYWSSGGSAF